MEMVKKRLEKLVMMEILPIQMDVLLPVPYNQGIIVPLTNYLHHTAKLDQRLCVLRTYVEME